MTGKMAQQKKKKKALDIQTWWATCHPGWKEGTDATKLPSDLHIHAVTFVCPTTHNKRMLIHVKNNFVLTTCWNDNALEILVWTKLEFAGGSCFFTILLWLLEKSKLICLTHTSDNSYLDKTLGQAVSCFAGNDWSWKNKLVSGFAKK